MNWLDRWRKRPDVPLLPHPQSSEWQEAEEQAQRDYANYANRLETENALLRQQIAGEQSQRMQMAHDLSNITDDCSRLKKKMENLKANRPDLDRIVKELLPIFDTWFRAAKYANEQAEPSWKIYQQTQRDLVQRLKNLGIDCYGTPGDEFNPELHFAYDYRRGSELTEIVVDVYWLGYRLMNPPYTVIRPARVIVAQARQSATA